MPRIVFTVDGCGLVFSGQKNLRTREGVCEFCHRQVTLREYDTWLCLAAFYIPLVPIRKVHVRNSCPECRRYFSTSLGKWQKLAEATLQERHEEFLARPSPQAATSLLAAMETFGPKEEAMDFADELGARFADDAGVQLALGGYYERWAEQHKGDAAYARAFELAPEDTAARTAVARKAIRDGDPARARELLAFMESEPGKRDPAVLVLLGEACQRQDDHAGALAAFRLAVEADSKLAYDGKFRGKVGASQGRVPAEKVLPRGSFFRTRTFRTSAIVVALVVALVAANLVVARNRTLYVTNGLGVPVQVSIDGGRPLTVPAGDFLKVRIGEGAHKAVATASGGLRDETAFRVRGSFIGRFIDNTAHVLNPFAAATLRWERVVYAKRPDLAGEGDAGYHFGREFYAIRVDYAFEAFPKEIRVSEGKDTARRIRIAMDDTDPLTMVRYMQTEPRARTGVLLGYMEAHLAADPNAEALLDAYTTFAADRGYADRARQFLQQALAAHPQRTEWQRHHQRLVDAVDPNAPQRPPAAPGGDTPWSQTKPPLLPPPCSPPLARVHRTSYHRPA